MKVALVHDWLTGLRGGERCLQAFLALYPEADIFTLLHVPGATTRDIDARVRGVSYLQRLPFSHRYYRKLLPLFPSAIGRFNLTGYDLVISLSSAAAKNVKVPRGTKHICYCFSPMRYIWDQVEEYLGDATSIWWPLVQKLRRWDLEGAEGVDHFVGISQFVAARIRCFYKKEAEVIYPPVDTSWLRSTSGTAALPPANERAFLYAGALVPYKRADIAVEAFNQLGLPLWVVGSGPLERALRKKAGKNVYVMSRASDAELASSYRRCRALIFPGIEDFGMVPVECMAAGRPVIGTYGGGLKESVFGIKSWRPNEGPPVHEASGVFIPRTRGDRVEALKESVRLFLQIEERFSERSCLKQAAHFSPARFVNDWNRFATRIGVDPGCSQEILRVAAQG